MFHVLQKCWSGHGTLTVTRTGPHRYCSVHGAIFRVAFRIVHKCIKDISVVKYSSDIKRGAFGQRNKNPHVINPF